MGNAAFDLSYLLHSSSVGLFRRMHEKELIKEYYNCLISTLNVLGVEEHTFKPTLEDLEHELERVGVS